MYKNYFALLSSVLTLTSLLALSAKASIEPKAVAQLDQIKQACATSFNACLAEIPQYERSDTETNISGKASILGFGGASDQTFAGVSKEIYYREIISNGVQYQIGVGYVITARQQDAKPTGKGAISGISVAGDADLGDTTFTTAIIGIAPDVGGDCTKPPLPKKDQALLCALNMQPAVSQDFFHTATTTISTAFKEWKESDWPESAGKSALCPQVIAYRQAERSQQKGSIKLTDEQKADLVAIQSSLQEICAGQRPNAYVRYRNGLPGRLSAAEITVAGGEANATRTVISQGYYRDRNYRAFEGGSKNPFYDDSVDHYVEIYVVGLKTAASLPSVLAAFVTLNASRQDQHVFVHTSCSGGAGSISMAPLEAASNDQVKQANDYATFVNGLRSATDSNITSCSKAP